MPDIGPGTARVLIAVRDSRVRTAVRTLLGAGGVEVVAEAESPAATLAMARAHTPDVVVIGVHPSDDGQGSELLRVLTADLGLPAVAISFERAARESALRAGASWFFDQDGVLDGLLDVLAEFGPSRSSGWVE